MMTEGIGREKEKYQRLSVSVFSMRRYEKGEVDKTILLPMIFVEMGEGICVDQSWCRTVEGLPYKGTARVSRWPSSIWTLDTIRGWDPASCRGPRGRREGGGVVGVWSGRWLGINEITAPPDLHLVDTVV